MALYVYGLMRMEDGARVVAELAEGSAELVEHGSVCALVSRVPESDLTLRRESALTHTDTLQAAFAYGPVLPVRFGTVLPDAATLKRDFLAMQAPTLLARLEALEEMGEMQLKATYLEEPLLRSILGASPRLAEAARRIRELPAVATHFDRINLGEAIHKAVEARRQEDSRRLIDELRDLAVAVSIHEPRHERGVLNAAFLVANDRVEAFDHEAERLCAEYAEAMDFKLIGPMPAHSFAAGSWDRGLAPETS